MVALVRVLTQFSAGRGQRAQLSRHTIILLDLVLNYKTIHVLMLVSKTVSEREREKQDLILALKMSEKTVKNCLWARRRI